jgi:hypothetical protein
VFLAWLLLPSHYKSVKMRLVALHVALTVLVTFGNCIPATTSNCILQVDTNSGVLNGFINSSAPNVRQFLGIPFAHLLWVQKMGASLKTRINRISKCYQYRTCIPSSSQFSSYRYSKRILTIWREPDRVFPPADIQ